MIWIGFGFIALSFIIRFILLYKFIGNISILCNMYDWKCVDENPEEYLLEILKENYYVNNEWSAYNFMFLKGPSPIYMYFSFKPINLDSFYPQEVINKVKNKLV